MRSIEKLEELAAKKREKIKEKQAALKKDTEALKDLEAEIERIRGEAYRRDLHALDFTPEEFDKFRRYVLSNKNTVLEVIDRLSEEAEKRKEGRSTSYE